MTFEEEFPGLKKKKIDMFTTHCENPTDGRRIAELKTNNKYFCENVIGVGAIAPDYFIKAEDIQKHCLDKQKVMEVIDKLSTQRVFDNGNDVAVIFPEDIKKELGLE